MLAALAKNNTFCSDEVQKTMIHDSFVWYYKERQCRKVFPPLLTNQRHLAIGMTEQGFGKSESLSTAATGYKGFIKGKR